MSSLKKLSSKREESAGTSSRVSSSRVSSSKPKKVSNSAKGVPQEKTLFERLSLLPPDLSKKVVSKIDEIEKRSKLIYKLLQSTKKRQQPPVNSIFFNPSGLLLFSASNDNNIYIYEVSKWGSDPTYTHDGSPLISKGSVIDISCSPDGKKIASVSYDRSVNIWDSSTRKLIKQIKLPDEDELSSVAFSPDGNILAVASGKSVHLLDVTQNYKRIASARLENEDIIRSITFSPDKDNKLLASASDDGIIKIWDLNNIRNITLKYTFDGHNDSIIHSVNFSPDGTLLASAGDDSKVILWDINSGNLKSVFDENDADGISSVVFSPDGKMVAASYKDNKIRIWRVSDGKQIGLLEDKKEVSRNLSFTKLSFSPDGKMLAVSSMDGIIYVWDVRLFQHNGGKKNLKTTTKPKPKSKTITKPKPR